MTVIHRSVQAAGSQPAKVTTIQEGNGSTVTISQDHAGHTSIVRSGGSAGGGGGFVVPTPPIPPIPVIPVDFGPLANVVPPQLVDVAYGFFLMCAVMVIGWPLARAFGRRIERRDTVAALPPGTSEQLQRIEQAVEAMAIEVERISESQRFMARLQKSSTAEPV